MHTGLPWECSPNICHILLYVHDRQQYSVTRTHRKLQELSQTQKAGWSDLRHIKVQTDFNSDMSSVLKISVKTCLSTLCPHSNSCILAQTQALPRFPFTAAVFMGRPVRSAAWPEIRTAPGMEHPVLATCQTPRGL